MAYSWRATVFTQAVISLALVMVLYVAKPQRQRRAAPLDLYFISVGGGESSPAEQRVLAKQMEATAKKYGVEFVVSIGDRGVSDPLLKSVLEGGYTFPSLQVPWYTVMGGHRQWGDIRYFQKQISIPLQHSMDIICIDTSALEDAINNDSLENDGWNQVEWLKEALANSIADWHIVIGRHPLKNCRVERHAVAAERLSNLLLPVFMKYGVHAYLHGHEQMAQHVQDNGIAYVGNPIGSFRRDGYVFQNETCSWAKDMQSGFVLHRVSPLEMEFYFMDSEGTILHRATLHQSGRAVL